MALAAISHGDITECVICLQTWTDPRSLPSCDHTFCLQCLKTYVKKLDEEGQDVRCPLCRKEFLVPDGGLDDLSKKASASLLEQQITELCDLCTSNISAASYCLPCNQNICTTCTIIHLRTTFTKNHHIIEIKEKDNKRFFRNLCSSYCDQHREEQVKLYCEDCKKLLCPMCYATGHQVHKCAAVNDAAQGFVDTIMKYQFNLDKRIGETNEHLGQIKRDINEFLQMITDMENKLQEKEEELIKLVKTEREQLRSELKQMKEIHLKEMNMKLGEITTELLDLQEFKQTSMELIDQGTEYDICRSVNGLLTDADRLIKPPYTDTASIGQLDNITVNFKPATVPDIGGYQVRLLGLIDCVGIYNNWKEPQSASQNKKVLTLDRFYQGMVKQLKERDDKIQRLDTQVEKKDAEIASLETQVKHKAAEIASLKTQALEKENMSISLRMQMKEKDHELTTLRIQLREVPAGKQGTKSSLWQTAASLIMDPEYGLAAIGSQLFVGRDKATHVEVYDTHNMTAAPNLLKINEEILCSPKLAACSHYSCLYVKVYISQIESVIYRVELNNSSVAQWTVKGSCQGLSVTKNHSLLVTQSAEKRVQEYTTHGSLVREISFHSSIDQPWHCIQLSNGHFVVCHGGYKSSKHGVCIVAASQQILKSYYGDRYQHPCYTLRDDIRYGNQLGSPCHLSVDTYDNIFVADYQHHRIVLFSRTLDLLGSVQTLGHKLSYPVAIHLDENNRRLYIGESNGRLIVVEVSIVDQNW